MSNNIAVEEQHSDGRSTEIVISSNNSSGAEQGNSQHSSLAFEKVDRKRGPARRAGQCSPTAAHDSRQQHQARVRELRSSW